MVGVVGGASAGRVFQRLTKFILDQVAVVTAELSTTHYTASPLVQGELEIPCILAVKMKSDKNILMLKRYEEKSK